MTLGNSEIAKTSNEGRGSSNNSTHLRMRSLPAWTKKGASDKNSRMGPGNFVLGPGQ